MKGLISIAQMRKKLRENGRGDFLPASLHELVHTIGGYNKQYNHYYNIDAFDYIFREDHFSKLKEIDERNRKPKTIVAPQRQEEDEIEMPIGYYKDMSKASQECLDDDEIDYARWNMFHRNESMVGQIKEKKSFDFDNRADEIVGEMDYKEECVNLFKKFLPVNPIIDCRKLKDIKLPIFKEFDSPFTPHKMIYIEMYKEKGKDEILIDWEDSWQSVIEDDYVEPKEIYSFLVRYFIAIGKIDVSKMRF